MLPLPIWKTDWASIATADAGGAGLAGPGAPEGPCWKGGTGGWPPAGAALPIGDPEGPCWEGGAGDWPPAGAALPVGEPEGPCWKDGPGDGPPAGVALPVGAVGVPPGEAGGTTLALDGAISFTDIALWDNRAIAPVSVGED